MPQLFNCKFHNENSDVYRKEMYSISTLALLPMISGLLDNSILLSDLIMLGHLGRGNLAAGVIGIIYTPAIILFELAAVMISKSGYAFYSIPWSLLEGSLSAQEVLVSRYLTILEDAKSARYWTFIALITTCLLCVPATAVFAVSPWIVSYFLGDVKATLVSKATQHVLLLLPGFWFHAISRVIQKHVQVHIHHQQRKKSKGIRNTIHQPQLQRDSRGHWSASLLHLLQQSFEKIIPHFEIFFGSLLGLGFNILGNYVFMFFIGMGFMGCGLATSIARLVVLIYMSIVLWRRRDFDLVREEFSNLRLLSTAEVNRDGGEEVIYNSISNSEIELANVDNYSHRMDNLTGDSKHVARVISSTSMLGEEENINHHHGEDDNEEILQSLISGDEIAAKKRTIRAVLPSIVKYLLLGVPSGIALCIDSWSYEVTAIAVSHMGVIVLNAHQILVVITTILYYTFPWALSIALSNRIGFLLATDRPEVAQIAARVGMVIGLFVVFVSTGMVYALGDAAGKIFTGDGDTVRRMREIAPLVAVFQLLFGTQALAQGILRAIAKNWDIIGYSFLAMWIVGVPVGMYLVFIARPSFDIIGLWAGLVTGMALLTAVLLLSLLGIDWRKEAIKTRLRMKQFSKPNSSDSSRRKSDATRNNSARINAENVLASNTRRQTSRFDSFINDDSSTSRRRENGNEEDEIDGGDEDEEFGADGSVEELQGSLGDESDRRVGTIRDVAASSFSSATFNILHYPSPEEELAELEMVEFAPVRI